MFSLSCSILGGDDTPSYSFTALSNPSDGGTVSPSSASFDKGETVSAQAVPASGYTFDNWSGDKTSSSNPLTFEIEEDTEVTAHFSRIKSNYSVVMTVTDVSDSMDLTLGQKESATSDFDAGTDKESPPLPPDGALHSYFTSSGMKLLHDFRSDTTLKASWELTVEPGSGDQVEFSWSISAGNKPGTLIIRDKDGTNSVDMDTGTSFSISVSGGSGSVIIEYKAD